PETAPAIGKSLWNFSQIANFP
ncbi:MAG: hypothetical protein V7641_2524, partial [Blastocatellia bacterium]